MTKIDIFSGFLGAGKTTLIKKLIKEAYSGEKLVLIENEFGDIGIDGGFMQEAGIEVTEMNSGCICCSLVGDFGEALKKVLVDYNPDRIIIEPSGVGKLSDVIKAVKDIDADNILLNSFTTIVDAKKCKIYMKNFGEFFNNQIENAASVILSHTAALGSEKINDAVKLIRQHNDKAEIITTEWEQLSGEQILKSIEGGNTLQAELDEMLKSAEHHHHDHDEECHCHEHHHHDHDEECHCHEHHHHDHDEECHCHEHHHHDHDEECHCHEHHHHDHNEECHCHEHHHHDHDEECHCHEHHHHDHDEECHCHEHHHHADEVFTSFGAETANVYTEEQIKNALIQLDNTEKCGNILRAKGIVEGADGWIHFDYVPGEYDVRKGAANVIGRLCVIGADINKNEILKLFALV